VPARPLPRLFASAGQLAEPALARHA